jgi:hypothetical protein
VGLTNGAGYCTVGAMLTLRAPELFAYVATDEAMAASGTRGARRAAVPPVPMSGAATLAHLLLPAALDAAERAMEGSRDAVGAAAAREQLLRNGLELRDGDNVQRSIVARFAASIDFEEYPLPPEAVRLLDMLATSAKAGAAVTWRFTALPAHSAVRAAAAAVLGDGGAAPKVLALGSTLLDGSLDDDGAAKDAPFPALVCDVRACLEPIRAGAEAGSGAHQALHMLLTHVASNRAAAAGAAPQQRQPRPQFAMSSADGGDDDCANCAGCRAKRRTGAMCARPGCGALFLPDGGALKRCARCLAAAYCTPACQKLDWKRHKHQDCAAAAAK